MVTIAYEDCGANRDTADRNLVDSVQTIGGSPGAPGCGELALKHKLRVRASP
jgi:hypothetical protein